MATIDLNPTNASHAHAASTAGIPVVQWMLDPSNTFHLLSATPVAGPPTASLSSYSPVMLVDVLLDGGTRLFATKDFYNSSDNFYKGTLQIPTVAQELADLYYGVERGRSLTLRFSNTDDGADDTWDDIIVTNADEPRGRWVLVQRYDPVDGITFVYRGKITNYVLGSTFELTLEMRDDDILETLLPKDVVTTDEFTATALDVGKAINICIGHCKNVPLRNIQNNLGTDKYDYLIGYGIIESLWVDHANDIGIKRDGVLVTPAEYTFDDGSGAPTDHSYAGYATIRFSTEQMDFSGGFHSLTADVYGLEMGGAAAERNFANVIKNFLSNATWGLGDNADATSFTAAESALNALGHMYCDGSITGQQKVRDILDELMFPARARIWRAADGEWEILIDQIGVSILNLGDNDGLYNNAEVMNTSAVPTGEALQHVIVQYSFDAANGDNLCKEIDIIVRSGFGITKTYKLPFVIEDATALKVLNYLKNRSLYSDDRAALRVGMEGRNLKIGQIVTVTAPERNLTAKEYIIEGFSKDLTSFELECREYSTNVYGIFEVDPPTEAEARGFPVSGPATWVGPILLGDGQTQPAQIVLAVAEGYGDTYIAAGTIETAAWTAAPGLLFGIDDSDDNKAKFFCGNYNAGAGPYMFWNGTTLTIVGTITATTGNIGGFYIGANDLWGGNAAIGNAATTIVMGNLDGTSKIALGASADAITIAGVQAGFIADGGGNLRVGDADSWLKWSAGVLDIQLASGEALTLQPGGDIILKGDDADPGAIIFDTDTRNFYMAAHFTNKFVSIWPGMDGDGVFNLGRNMAGAMTRFNDIDFVAKTDIWSRAYFDAGHNAYLQIQAGATYARLKVKGDYLAPTTNGGVALGTSSLKWSQGWFDDYVIAMGGIHVGGTAVPGANNLLVDGLVGVGIVTSVTYQFRVKANISAGYAAYFLNDGNNADRYGLIILCGEDDQSASIGYHIRCYDGDGGHAGGLRHNAGTMEVYQVSDKRLKQDIIDTAIIGREKIMQLRLCDFRWNSNPEGEIHTGFVSDELMNICPEAVARDPESGILMFAKTALIEPIVKHAQEMQTEIDKLTERLKLLKDIS